jgi:DNA (cytosine-5)-methyltransferase 1
VQVQPRVIDLFCGCGGFSLGAHAVGLGPVAAFDVDPVLSSSYAANHPRSKLHLADLAVTTGHDIRREVGSSIDGILGGPPCQPFSDIGHRSLEDPRRSLLGHFFRLVAELRPAFFVLENVRGLGYADAKPVLDSGLQRLPGTYEVVGPVILDAADFGAATRRPRLFVFGYQPSRFDRLRVSDFDRVKSQPATVREAIGDLSLAARIGEVDGLDVWRLSRRAKPSRYASQLRATDSTFTSHRKTTHTAQVTQRFEKIEQGTVDPIGRHPRLAWEGQCPTLRAGTGKDRGSYQSVRPIHPVEPRVITVREAARLQGFPDSFRFHRTVWHSFRMIGNSVSPFVSKALFTLIAKRLGTV